MDDQFSSKQLSKILQGLKEKKYGRAVRGEIDESTMSALKKKEQQIMDAIAQRSQAERAAEGKGRLVKGSKQAAEEITSIKGGRNVIDTKTANKLKSGSDFTEGLAQKLAKSKALRSMAKMAGKGLKAVPLVGGLASALMSGDASAAIPVLNEAEGLGPQKGSLESTIENPDASKEARRKAIEILSKRNKQ